MNTIRLLLVLVSAASTAAAQSATITEFMARNATTLADEDGDFSDWIEVTVDPAASVNLSGWFLTDDPQVPTKWSFPAVTVSAGTSLVIFASGKDRAQAGSELHTNFALSGDGEYLALIEPNGITVASEFSPTFPIQRTDVSFGTNLGAQVLVGPAAACTALVPADSGLGQTWTQSAGGAPVLGAVAHWMLDETGGSTAMDAAGNGHDGTLIGFTGNPWGPAQHGGGLSFDGGNDYVSMALGSSLPIFGGSLSAYTISAWVKGPPQDDDRIYSEGSNQSNTPLFTLGTGRNSNGTTDRFQTFIRNDSGATLLNQQTQTPVFDNTWHHVTWVDDGGAASVWVDGVLDPVGFGYTQTGTWSAMNRVSLGAVLRGGTCCFAQCELDDVRVFDRALTPTEIQDVMNAVGASGPAWASGVTGVGYELLSGYQSLIGLDVQSAMAGTNASAYIRIPFTVSDPNTFSGLELRMKYDDGFVSYLNGQLVVAANAPVSPVWNSAATVDRPDVLAQTFDSFDVSAYLGSLQAGGNVLAIHGLNSSAGNDDFLIVPELEATSPGPPLAYFSDPTPGAPNAIGLAGLVADPAADPPRGFATNPIAVTLSSATPSATIRYTLDGSEPTLAAPIYAGPITVSTTSVLRARAFLAGWVPSLTSTWTWIFAADVAQQPANPPGFPATWTGAPAADYEMDPEIVTSPLYAAVMNDALTSLPAVSIVTDPDHLFGPSGIYVNPQQEGVAWERPASVEWIYPDGTPGFQVACGLRIQGGASRLPTKSPKHSFRLLFKNEYGPSTLEYPWFEGSNVASFETVILRGHFGNSWIHWRHSERAIATFMRDQWIKDTHRAMGHASPHNNYAHLYVNGLYWGLYNPTERPSAPFLASHLGGDREDYDAIKAGAAVDGSTTAWNTAMSMANAGLSTPAAYAAIQQYVDVTNLADYMLLNHYGGNWDWDHHNWYAGRKREPGAGFRFYCWDSEHVIEDVNANELSQNANGNPSRIFTRLVANPEFVVHLGDRLHRHLFNDGALTPSAVQSRWQGLRAQIETAVVAESARWGDYRRDVHPWQVGPYQLYTKNTHWLTEQTRLASSYLPQRTAIVVQQYRSAGWYPAIDAPILSQHGGPIAASTPVTMSAPAGAIWYTLDGTDPRLAGGAVSPTALNYASALTFSASTTISIRARSGSTWSALTQASFTVEGITINEILARNVNGIMDPAGENEDWIELVNASPIAIDLSGYWLTDDLLNPQKWPLPAGTLLMPGETLLVWADDDPGQGPYHATFKLATGGETVGLFLPDGVTLQDSRAFGPQIADVSYGRLFDGGVPWVTYPAPTPDALNDPGACGTRRYGPTDPTAFAMTIDFVPDPTAGQTTTLQLRTAPPLTPVTVFAATAPASIPLAGSNAELLIDPTLTPFVTLGTNVWGEADLYLPLPNLPALAGVTFYFQAAAVTAAGLIGSTAVEVRICP
ncbi:MAG: hypothetical protein CMJ83_01655 [Planctomycetes bacterium]|nr:hypothetical protein [Planctomycetota bacterium]